MNIPQLSGESPPNRWLVLLAVMLAFLPIVLDLTILHVAVPSLTLALKATGTEVLWIIDIYPLLMAGLLIPMGTLADRIGHRRLLLAGLSIFTLGSICAAFSPSPSFLIGSRAIMAFGSAMVMPCSLAILRQAFKVDRERALALGVWSSMGSAGAALGPVVGGLLLEHFWWGSIFLVNVPVMLLVLPLVAVLTPRISIVTKGNWTIMQAVVLTAGIMAVVYALKSVLKPEASLPIAGVALLVGLAMLGWFIRAQLRAAQPMLDMSLFSKPAISAGVIMALVVMSALAGVELMLAQELQFVLGYTALEAGVFMLPLMVGAAIGGPLAGVIMGALGLRMVASTSLLLAGACLAGLAHGDLAHAGLGTEAMLAGLGLVLGVGLTASSVAIMSSTPPEKAGSAGALEATSYDLGTGLGITGFGLLMANSYQNAIRLPEELASQVTPSATQSIGETMIAAQELGGTSADLLIAAAQQAFGATHAMVLLSSAILVGISGLSVLFALHHYRDPAGRAPH